MPRITFEARPFRAALTAVLPAAARDAGRPVLSTVLVNIGRGKVELVACDNYRIARAPVTGEIAKSGKVESFLIPAAEAAAIVKALPGKPPKYGGHPPLTVTRKPGGEMVVALNGWSIAFTPPLASYPNFEAVMPKGKPTMTVALNATLLGELLRAVEKNGTVVLGLRAPKPANPYQPVEITTHVTRDEQPATYVLMNVRLGGQS